MAYLDLAPVEELFSPTSGTELGWRVPVEGQLTSYVYFGPHHVAFEVWLGYDFDVTVKLQRPFTFGRHDDLHLRDPRTIHKPRLASILGIASLEIVSFFVTRSGRLEIEFTKGKRLAADPASDERAWIFGWPLEGPSRVASKVGGGIEINPPAESWGPDDVEGSGPAPSDPGDEVTPPGPDPVLTAPGVIRQVAACGATIELLGRTSKIAFNGPIAISSAVGADWHGNAGYETEDRPMLGPLLDFLGAEAVRCHVDPSERLHVEFSDGRKITAGPGAWEA